MSQSDVTSSRKVGRTSRKRQKRPWPVTAIGLLMLLQAAGLFSFGLLHVGASYLVQIGLLDQILEQGAELLGELPVRARALVMPVLGVVNEELLLRVSERSLDSLGLLFFALSALAVLAAVSFLRTRHNAWASAMLVQGLCLLIALVLYFSGKPVYVYVMMLYGILMVLYLNYHEVRDVFRAKPGVEEQASVHRGEGR